MASRRRQKDERRRERAAQQPNVRDEEAFRRRIEDTHGKRFVPASPGQEKMSDVLEAFVDPYVNETATHADLVKLYGVAVAAWNLALFPPDQQRAALDQTLHNVLPGASRDDVEFLRRFVEDLVARKNLLFPDNRRAIIAFELLESENGDPYLQVASTLA